MKSIIVCALVCLTLATPIVTTTISAKAAPFLRNSDDFISEIQGKSENIYIIVFEKDDKDYITDLKAALDASANDATLKQYDNFQASFDNKFEIRIGQVDARDLTNFKQALDLIGANSADWTMTYPVALVVKKGDGYLASLKEFASKDKKLTPALQDKLLKASKAKLKKVEAAAPAAAAAPAPAGKL